MSELTKIKIEKSEQQLRLAMLQSDVIALDKLLAPELRFTNHLGQLLTKEDDISAHASGTLAIDDIRLSDQHILCIGDTAIVTLASYIKGSYAGIKSEANFRFTRIWSHSVSKEWQVVCAHSSIVAIVK